MNDLLRHHGADDPVAFGQGGLRTAHDLRRDASTIAAAVRTQCPSPDPKTHALMVFEHDRYAFAAGLLGAWTAGLAVALPPNGRAQSIASLLAQPDVGCLLHDTQAGGHIQVPQHLTAPGSDPPFHPLSLPEAIAVTIFTSGTTADHEAWTKTATQLMGEVAVLARLFAPPHGSRSVVTVPSHHLYGLLFGVLLPLCTGGAFGRETPLLPEAVVSRIESNAADTVVSVPVHLRTLRAEDPQRMSSVRRVFCSTAPLDDQTHQTLHAALGQPITEIFGSTETGGIAWRHRNESEAWRPLPGVTVTVDDHGVLLVDSNFLPAEAQRPWPTADLATLNAEGSFIHHGRADGVVKVGGRRISLPQLQRWLLTQPGVLDAEVVGVPAPGRGTRILAAVVAPSVDEQSLRESMLTHFDPTTVPRRLLNVDRLPREASGKLPRRALLAVFGLRSDGLPATTQLPTGPLVPDSSEPLVLTTQVTVPRDYLYFEGHFETYPILAGVAQLHELLLPLVAQARPHFGPLRELARLKFLGRIEPGDDLSITLRFHLTRAECDFEIAKGPTRCSAGRLRFGPSEIQAP